MKTGLIKRITGLFNRHQHKDLPPEIIERKNVQLKADEADKKKKHKELTRFEKRAQGHGGFFAHPLYNIHFGNFRPMRPIARRGNGVINPDMFGRLCLSKKWKGGK
jgi:hypothetical protein